VDPIRPITNSVENIPPVVATGRVERVTRRQRDPGEDAEHEPDTEQDGDDESPPDDGHPHVDVSA
jgi:hypothetical protein